jgi:hypothetical protein
LWLRVYGFDDEMNHPAINQKVLTKSFASLMCH